MLISLLSLKGSPGVSTLAAALAARWPAPARTVLVEADPSGGDLALRFSLLSTPGLVSWAAAARRAGDDPDLVWRHTQQLPGGLPVVAAPPDADQARAALAALAPDPASGLGGLRAAAEQQDTVVVVDAGRLDPGSPTLPIVPASDAVVLLTRAGADDLAHLPRRLPVISRWSPNPMLLLIGDGYSSTEIARELGVPPWGHVPHDPKGAAVLRGQRGASRWRRTGPTRSALGRFASQLAADLAARHQPPVSEQETHDAATTGGVGVGVACAREADPIHSGGQQV
ncbi:chromosome partitioning protein [Actinokineospora diospyrosa]|uniref:MinD-like ATPase involved in chromosome partitioning or flagellar assembly n=1 Tax=Actinokineospora diospyrosa TaxID=103728 RepID=A0ABT1I9E4_9PSEU|nr:chromosome partitioning protein [Actinokineospora diospyrosa]MCP2269245.1 MinD-like ATPase involved in chromosome partitioning or flagellar assembly [Actinokineospora diospyrosa]